MCLLMTPSSRLPNLHLICCDDLIEPGDGLLTVILVNDHDLVVVLIRIVLHWILEDLIASVASSDLIQEQCLARVWLSLEPETVAS